MSRLDIGIDRLGLERRGDRLFLTRRLFGSSWPWGSRRGGGLWTLLQRFFKLLFYIGK